jgi:NADP-dependent 3-hydroxy acid dehydrogenase YdfG
MVTHGMSMTGGNVAEVTGAESGMGHAAAIASAKHGYSVMPIGKTERTLDQTAATIGTDEIPTAQADVGDKTEVPTGCEYRPRSGTLEGLGWLRQFRPT